jgi:hypothetical protein
LLVRIPAAASSIQLSLKTERVVDGTLFLLIDKFRRSVGTLKRTNVVVAAPVAVAVASPVITINATTVTTAATVGNARITMVDVIKNLTDRIILMSVANRAIQPELIGIRRYPPMPILKGKRQQKAEDRRHGLSFSIENYLVPIQQVSISSCTTIFLLKHRTWIINRSIP